jgi:hypothetical protein
LLDIQKIAALTRKIFGSDDLTIFIPKVWNAPQFISYIYSFYARKPISLRFVRFLRAIATQRELVEGKSLIRFQTPTTNGPKWRLNNKFHSLKAAFFWMKAIG